MIGARKALIVKHLVNVYMKSSPIRLAIEIGGIITGLLGFVALFISELYAIGIFALTMTFVLLWLIFYLRRNRGIESLSTRYEYKIVDAKGHRAEVSKLVRFRVHEKTITRLIDRDISAAGKIEDVRSNIGDSVSIGTEAGLPVIYTNFTAPIEPGIVHEHELEYVGIDCFLSAHESVSCAVTCPQEYVEVHVIFPDARKPVNIQAFEIVSNRLEKCDSYVVDRDGGAIHLRIERPVLGSRYNIEWDW